MNLTSPAPVSPATRLDDSALDLRVNQRLNAEVLKLGGGQVVLAVQGVQIVGRLSSPEQAAVLIERQFAHFIVKDISGQAVTLQVVPLPAGSTSGPPPRGSDLAAGVLEQAGIPVTAENIQLARAAIAHGLEITSTLLKELRSVLSSLGAWDARALQTAAALKATGLPLTPGSLNLALQQHTDMTQTLQPLLANLRGFLSGGAPPELQHMAQAVLDGLEGMVLPGNLPTTELAERLHQLTSLLGRPLEGLLRRQLLRGENSPETLISENMLLTLAELRAGLTQSRDGVLAAAIDRFLDGTRWTHFLNLPGDPAPDRGQWIGLNFPIQCPHAKESEGGPSYSKLHSVRLRIARDADSQNPQVHPGYTRLVVQVDLAPGETLQVDFSIVERQIGAEITASTTELSALAKDELPGLEAGLAESGYHLLTSEVRVGKALPAEEFELPAPAAGDVPCVDLLA